jgi:hypothetical protein
MLLIDVAGSMGAHDLKPSRIAAEVAAAQAFVARRPTLLVQPTLDRRLLGKGLVVGLEGRGVLRVEGLATGQRRNRAHGCGIWRHPNADCLRT